MTRSAANTLALEVAYRCLQSHDDFEFPGITQLEETQVERAFDKIAQAMFERLERAQARHGNTKISVPTTRHR